MSPNKNIREHAPQHFNILARSLHWLMAGMILAMLFIGAAMMTSLHHRIWLIDPAPAAGYRHFTVGSGASGQPAP